MVKARVRVKVRVIRVSFQSADLKSADSPMVLFIPKRYSNRGQPVHPSSKTKFR